MENNDKLEAAVQPKQSWWKLLLANNLFGVALGAVLTLLATIITNYNNNNQVFKKESIERKKSYIDDYMKDLTLRFELGNRILEENGIMDSTRQQQDRVLGYKQKIEDLDFNLGVNSFYDSIQFKRFNLESEYVRIHALNTSINSFITNVEGNDKNDADSISSQQKLIMQRINLIRKDVYDKLEIDDK